MNFTINQNEYTDRKWLEDCNWYPADKTTGGL